MFQSLLNLQYAVCGIPNRLGCSETLPVGSKNEISDSAIFEDDISQRILVIFFLFFSWGDTDPRAKILLTSTPDPVPSLFFIFRSRSDKCT